MSPPGDLRDHLVRWRLAGDVATRPDNVVDRCERMASGHLDYTFGLDDWKDLTADQIIDIVSAVCGRDAVALPLEQHGWIDPDATMRGIAAQRELLAATARPGLRILAATGHPSGLLQHYNDLVASLRAAGCRILSPLDDQYISEENGTPRGIRFIGGVACVWRGGDLLHSHRPDYMERMLDEIADATDGDVGVDLVIGDHGMAGAAIQRGITTLAIADVNDPALMVAEAFDRPAKVIPIDDNLAPRLYEPMTREILGKIPNRRGA